MDMKYYETVRDLEQKGVNPEYVQGWMGGYLHNPKREEQRVTEPYEAGYADGQAGKTDGSSAWMGSA